MKRRPLNFVVDVISFIIVCCLITTGIIMKYILPPGSGGRGRALHGGGQGQHIKSLLSMTRHQWGDIHFYLAAAFTLLMLTHLILHYNWIKNYCKGLFIKPPDS